MTEPHRLPVASKVCRRCRRELPNKRFLRMNESKDGLQAWCKECKAKYDSDNNTKAKRDIKRWAKGKLDRYMYD